MELQPMDLTQVIVALITTAGVIYSARRQHIQQDNRAIEKPSDGDTAKRKAPWGILAYVSLILLVANLGVLGWRYWGMTTELRISYPYDGDHVGIREVIRGTSQRIPEGQAIWVVVYPHPVGRYFPQNQAADIQANGDWASLTFIGIEADVGMKFDIIALLVDRKAQEAFAAYLAEAKDKKTWPGLERLPDGTRIYDRITVTRK
jgi:hypothetical protein